MIVAAVLGAVALYHYEKESGNARYVFEMATISKVSAADPATWYRLVVGLFIHGADHSLQALIVFGAVLYGGLRVERALGAGAMLLCFLAGGVAGDAVRAWLESSALLQASAGTTAGALALIGAGASIQIRTRERGFLGAILAAIGSALFTTFLSAAPQQAPSIMRVLPPMLPAAGTSFLVGGFLAGLLPLYDPARRRVLRGVLLAVSLVTVVAAGAFYWSELWPLIRPSPLPREHPVDEPELEMKWDSRLPGYDFGLPISHRIETGTDQDRGVTLAPNRKQLPIAHLMSTPRADTSSADAVAFLLARAMHDASADAKALEEGEISGCPLGPAYRHILRITRQDQTTYDWQICIAQTPSEYVRIEILSDRDELDEARALGTAIVRSLKVHSSPADKKGGGRSR